MDTFESQMKADMAWVRLVRRKMYSDAQVTQKELEKAMAEAKTDLSTPKYFVSEIYIRKKMPKTFPSWSTTCVRIRALSFTPCSFHKARPRLTAAVSAG